MLSAFDLFMCRNGVVVRGGNPEMEVVGLDLACYTFHKENRSYFGTDTTVFGTENVRENDGKRTQNVSANCR